MTEPRERRVYAGAAAYWDEHRNTSRVFAVSPEALPAALRAVRRFRSDYPRMAAWLDAGAPAIHSEEAHRRWFGVSYKRGHLT